MKKRLIAVLMILALLLSVCGCVPSFLLPEGGTLDYSYSALKDAVCNAVTDSAPGITLYFARHGKDPAPELVEADLNTIYEQEYLPARFVDSMDWEYTRQLFYYTLTLSLDYTGDTDLISTLSNGNNPGLVPLEFTTATLADWMERLILSREESDVCLFSGTGEEIDSLTERYISDANETDPLFCYYTDTVTWETLETAGVTELTLTVLYRDDTLPYDSIPTVSNEYDAVSALISAWRGGSRMATVILEDASWDHATLFDLAETAEANFGELGVECTYFNANVYPVEGKRRIAEIWLTFPMMDAEVERRTGSLTAAVNAASSKLASRNITDKKELYRAIHDYVVATADYSDRVAAATVASSITAEMYSLRTAYGALVEGGTVCTGYARAFKALCDSFELPCWVLYGYSDDTPHAWNAVLLDGEVRFVDCTFDDADRTGRFFLLSAAAMKSDGYVINDAFTLPDWME